ncbi:MAG: TonB family protein [Acidobacteria bacterium]|nr:TonB family protein [Acidobacteriota bacterium]
MKTKALPFLSLALCALAACSLSWAQEPDPAAKVAGTEVPVPRRTKTVQPEYPAEAREQGLRGIVILDLVIDEQGKVASAEVLRSVPPFDEAALAAVRKWEYEVTKLDGRPVRVRLTVPITFAMKLPEVWRQEGIPELRSGAVPAHPAGPPGRGTVTVVAEVTLEADGRVAEALIRSGDAPWSEALIQALRTWRFAPEEDEAMVSFRVEADFVPAGKGEPAHVDIRVNGLRRSETAVAPEPSPQPPPTAAASPSPSPHAPAPVAAGPPSPVPAPAGATGEPPPGTAPPAQQSAATEVVSAPALGPGSSTAVGAGVSSVADVVVAPGAPDLARGRRPVVPPLARIGGITGGVEVRFSVDAAGATTVQLAEGPDPLKTAASQAVETWVFRRVSADRLYLVAVFEYGATQASATVRPAPREP